MPKVVHLVTADTPADNLEQLRRLAGSNDRIISIGPAPTSVPLRQVQQVHRPLSLDGLAARELVTLCGDCLLHAWSDKAVPAAWAAANKANRPLLVSLPSVGETGSLARHAAEPVNFTVPTEAARRKLLAAGFEADRLHVLAPAVDSCLDQASRREQMRRRLSLRQEDLLLLVPCQMSSCGGHKYAIWIQAIVRQIHEGVKLLFARGGSAASRIRFFADTTGYRDDMIFCSDGQYEMDDMLAAADLSLLLQDRDCGVWDLAASMAAGLAMVATRLDDAVEIAGDAAMWAEPEKPRSQASALLQLVDSPELRQKLSQAAKSRAAAFSVEAARLRLADIYGKVR